MRRTWLQRILSPIAAAAIVCALTASCNRYRDVQILAVAHNDLGQTGTQAAENTLTPANVSKMVLLSTLPIDDFDWAQTLFVPGVTIWGVRHNVLYVATNNDTIYAFDTDSYRRLWMKRLDTKMTTSSYGPDSVNWGGATGVGCVSTPVVDVTNNYLYVVCALLEPSIKLYKLNSITGTLLDSVTVAGSVRGSGVGSRGGTLTFSANFHIARPALTLANGNAYVSIGGFDAGSWHGWVMSYNANTMKQNAVWCSTPNSIGGSIWMSGGAPAIDGGGNLYVTTGNGGRYDGITEFENSVVKLSPALKVLDHFTPANWETLNKSDADVSSNRFVLISGSKYGVVAAKDFNVYVIDTTCMGGLQGSSSGCSIQSFQTNGIAKISEISGSFGATFMNNRLFLPLTTGDLYAFTWTGSNFVTIPLWHNTTTYGWPGPSALSGSWNGSTNDILWATTSAMDSGYKPRAAVLHAINPATGVEYWNSGNALGNLAKYNAPTIANGKVFVASQSNAVYVFGLPPSATKSGEVVTQ